FFLLPLDFVYSQEVASDQYKSLTGNFSKDGSGLLFAEKFGDQVLMYSQIAQSDYAQSSNGDTSPSTTTLSSSKSGSGDWYFSIAPYAWMLSLNGTIGVKGQTADVNMSFGDIFEQAEFAGQLHGELFYKNRYGLFLDGTYVKLSTDSVKGPITSSTTTKIFMFEFAGMYRVYSAPTSYAQSQGYEKSSINVDLLLGGRYYNIDNKINFRSQGPMNIPSVSGDEGWFDFMAGGRVIWQATDRWSFLARTDFGGFDFNFSSTFSWNGVGFVGFDATDWLDILLGFRALYTDYSDGKGDNRFVFDTWLYGPVIGLNFHN
nr:hypothetical protein [Phycisphaerae bacterium]NIP55549.1 hypothetical protein [Phycisphaerae bacterium]NIU12327.1 hypothetical protein [Phycisphaerae bacterium]NIX01999.1 hypothetical protein [Phycisphaerae bacterium]NIX31785.1 hypothetical protein [Phycisphaerae bacterium]